MSKRPEDYDGALHVPQELLNILNQPGYVSVFRGGQRAREIYRSGTVYIKSDRLSPFGRLCYIGDIDGIRKEIESGTAPPLSSTETPYKWGYAILVLFGAQAIEGALPKSRHLDTIEYLVLQELPVDIPDIAGWTALSHAAMAPIPQPEIMKVFLKAGANPNHQGRYGDVPLFNAFQRNNSKETDLLLEYNADLDIPEADGLTPRNFFLTCGPQITAVVQKHIQKRAGNEALRSNKECDNCHRSDVALRNCSKCQVARYCNTECQRAAWPLHKKVCRAFSKSNTLVVRPYYQQSGVTFQPAAIVRESFGLSQEPTPLSHRRGSHIPKEALAGEVKSMVVKVQVPINSNDGALFVYNKKRDFVCSIRKEDGASSYDQLSRIVKEKGVGGLKAYFAAELKNKDELVVKVSEVLAEQPF